MWTKRFSVLLAAFSLMLLIPGLSRASRAQGVEVFASGGALFSDAPATSNLDGTLPMGQVGARLPYTDLFTLQGAAAYQELISLEGTLQFHPLGRISGVKPYAFGGFGYYVSGNDQRERSVVPLGVGAHVPIRSGLGLNLEVGGRWTLSTNEPPASLDLTSGIAPSVGLTYTFGTSSSSQPDEDDVMPPLADGGTSQPDATDEAEEERPAPADAPSPVAENAPAGEGRPDRDPVAEQAPMGSGAERPDPVARTAPMPEGRQRRARDAARRDTTDEQGTPGGEMRGVPAGTFVMGLTDEDPLDLQQAGRKRVSVTPFNIDKYEVSNEEYRSFLSELSPDQRQEMSPDSTIWEQARSRSTWGTYFRGEQYATHPVVGVTQEQAQNYCEFYDKRLPTEAEWEYAARGDLVGSIYPWQGYEPRNNRGRYLANYNPERGGYSADGYAFTAPGDAYPPSSWGLYNMSGNVAEWVQDKYHSSYSELSDFNPLYENPDEDRYIVRGGSWESNAFYIGVGVRDSQNGSAASPYVGFRCASDEDAN